MSRQSQKIHFHWRQRRTCLLFLATVRAKRARRRTQEKGLQKQSVQFQRRQCWAPVTQRQPPPLQAVDPLDLALAGLGVPNLFEEVPSSDWAKAAKRGFKKLSLVHHPDKGGSRAAYDNLCRSWDVVRQHIADWTKIGDLMRCEIQCRCTDCLRLMTKMSRRRLCLGLGSKSGHSGCGLTSASSYFRKEARRPRQVLPAGRARQGGEGGKTHPAGGAGAAGRRGQGDAQAREPQAQASGPRGGRRIPEGVVQGH